MKNIKVGFEFSLVSPEHGGIFQYSFYILRLLKTIDEIEIVYIFCNDAKSSYLDEFRDLEKFKIVEYRPYGVLTKELRKIADFFLNRHILGNLSRKSFHKLYYWLNPDTYYFNNFNLDVLHTPWHISRVFGIKAPVVVTVHDLVQLHFPEFFNPVQRIQRSITFSKSILLSEQIISSFEHVKLDLQKFFLLKENKTSVCPVPLSTDGFATKKITSFKELIFRYNIPEKFILTPAASWPHKNHIGMLYALKILKDSGRQVCWIATGPKQNFFHDVIEPKIEELGLNKQVLFTDIIPQEDLIGLYKATKLVVMPTLYEAGSGPLFEAMRFSIPVIVSNVTSLPESIDNQEFVFDPHNYQELAKLIEKGLDDNEFREKSIINSKARIEYYASLDYKKPILEAYRKALEYKKRNS